MEEVFAKAEELISDVKKYVENRVSATKLNAAEQLSEVGSKIVTMMVVAVVFVFSLVFAGIALGYAFSRWTGEYYWGFLIVAGIYLLIGFVVWTGREKLIRLPILNALLHQLFKNEEH